MSDTKLTLTIEEANFVVSALNEFWHTAHEKIKNHNNPRSDQKLGIVEKQMYERRLIKAKELMERLD